MGAMNPTREHVSYPLDMHVVLHYYSINQYTKVTKAVYIEKVHLEQNVKDSHWN